jgi:SAM-dependent methyltransferase
MNDTTAVRLQAFWNERYAGPDYAYGTAPNDFLVACLPWLAPRGRVLCLGDGEGRNSVWLAQQGLRVTAVDIADAGLRKTQRLAAEAGVEVATVHADVTGFDFGSEPWDAVVSIFLHLPPAPRRALHARAVAALAPGGVFVFEAYTKEQVAYASGGPVKEPDLLVAPADLETEFPGCVFVHRFSGVRRVVEGKLHHGDAHVAQVVARKT